MTYQIGMGEIAKAGYDPDSFFRRTIFTDSKPQKVVENVLSGKADVGFPSCMHARSNGAAQPAVAGKAARD